LDATPEALHAKLMRRRRRWREVIGRTLEASTTDRMSLAAAGCAFYATLALFPAISMLISVYGLVFDPIAVEEQLGMLSGFLPPQGYALISDRIHQLLAQPDNMLSLNLIVGFLLTFWSSSSGSKSALSAVNVAYQVTEQRPFIRAQVVGFSVTLVAVVCAVLAIGFLVVLPVAIDDLGLMKHGALLVHLAGMAVLVGLFFLGSVMLYSYGPCRNASPDDWIKSGAAVATVMWIIASELLSLYASRMSSFGATYGSLGAVVAIMLWFYVSAYALLLGAELNATLEEVLTEA
jgi:membrane protein